MVGNAKYITLTEQSSVKLSKICPEGGNSLKPMKGKQITWDLRRMWDDVASNTKTLAYQSHGLPVMLEELHKLSGGYNHPNLLP